MLWAKALHLIFMVTWFAGLFYLPRLFVYHSLSEDKISTDRFKIMQRKLFYGIMTPGLLLTVGFGIWLLSYRWAYLNDTWFQLKMALLISLIIYHGICWKHLIAFKYDRNRHGHVYYRWFNEIPVLMLVLMIILAVVRPFSN